MLATLPMYDWPEVWADNDARWTEMRDRLRTEGVDAPEKLDRQVGYQSSWTRSDLVLGEACGLPYIEALKDEVALIGAMDLELEGCNPAQYNSLIIVHQMSDLSMDDLNGKPYAFNTACSQSGLASIQKMGLTDGDGVMSGGHRASIQMIAEGTAEFAAIDARSWKLALTHEPRVSGVRIIGATPPTPAPVYIAAKGADVARYRRALKDVVPVTPDDYLSLL